ncbi:PRC1 regulator, partial [Thinocorus orbignyianus]|nr:PRC1 regulator [Thinocorus orbignyianus]
SPSGALIAESVVCLNQAMMTLRDIWREIGIPEELQLERIEAVKTHVKGLLDMMISEEENLKEYLLNSITACRRELNTLHRELQLDPFEVEEQGTILETERYLRTCVQALLKEKAERKQELKTLQEQDQELCNILCAARFPIDSDAVPSMKDLDLFRSHLVTLSAEKERRREEFVSTKQQILLLMEELEHSPENSFEQDVVSSNEEDFCLSQHNIAALQSLRQQLEAQQSLNAEVCVELRSRITELWERLQVPAEERELSAVY